MNLKMEDISNDLQCESLTVPGHDGGSLSGSAVDAPNGNASHSLSPLVTVVIPCYKGERFLADAIESCLRQSHHNLEIIVVDDASPDNCAQIADQYAKNDHRLRVIRHAKNGGVSRAFNTGFNAAFGKFMVRLAQDDYFRDDTIEAMVRHLEANPAASLTYTNIQSISEDGRLLAVGTVPNESEALAWRNGVGLCVMWRREVWDKIGGFDPDYDTAEDFEYWVRASRYFALSKCPHGPYLFARIHDNQGSVRFADKQEAATIKIIGHLFPPNSFKNRLLRRRALSYNAYSAATDYSYSGVHATAFIRMIRSFVLWPIPYPRQGRRPAFIPTKTLIVIVLRLLRLRPHTAPDATSCVPNREP